MPISLLSRDGSGLSGGRLKRLSLFLGLLGSDLGGLTESPTQGLLLAGGFL